MGYLTEVHESVVSLSGPGALTVNLAYSERDGVFYAGRGGRWFVRGRFDELPIRLIQDPHFSGYRKQVVFKPGNIRIRGFDGGRKVKGTEPASPVYAGVLTRLVSRMMIKGTAGPENQVRALPELKC